MQKLTNRKFTLASRPVGMPKESDFKLVETPVLDTERRRDDHSLRCTSRSIRTCAGRMSDAKSYAAPVEIGGVMVGGVVGEVIESNNPGLPRATSCRENSAGRSTRSATARGCATIDPSIAPISTALGVLGMPGLTAYFGLLDIGQPKPGETVVVSGAAGAVGSIVGQIAKIKGCRAVGTAGSDDKVRYAGRRVGIRRRLQLQDHRRTTPRSCK